MEAVKRFHYIFWAALITAFMVITSGCGNAESHSSAQAGSGTGVKTYVVATRGTAKPFSYTDDQGNLTGYDVEILKEVERRDPSIHFTFKTMSVDAAFVAMDSGQVDIIANQMRHTPARDAKYLYTKEINNYTVRKLVVKKGRTDIHSLDDLKGKKIMVTTNSEMNTIVKDFNKTADPQIQVVYTDKGSAESLNMVATGRIDACGEYVYVTENAEKTLGLPVQVTGPILHVFDSHYLLRKDPEVQEAADKIDHAIASMRSDGTLKKLSEQYLGADYTVKPEE